MMTSMDIARRFMERGIAFADMAAFDECSSPDIVVRTGLSQAGPIVGLPACKQIFREFAHTLPVIDFVIHEVWPSAMQWTWGCPTRIFADSFCRTVQGWSASLADWQRPPPLRPRYKMPARARTASAEKTKVKQG
jgi:hypothetical protein